MYRMAVVVGLVVLFFVYSSAASVAENGDLGVVQCSVATDFLPRWTVSAFGVFEGKLEYVNQSGSEQINATFTVKRWLKGSAKLNDTAGHVIVALLSATDKHESSGAAGVCPDTNTDPQTLSAQRNYLVFFNRSKSAKSDKERISASFYKTTRFPQLSSKSLTELVKSYSCAKCGKIKLKLTPKAVRTPLNKNVLLKCQVSGKPMPAISWMKNGQALSVDVNKNVTSIKQGSQLLISRTAADDEGRYQCRAVNPVESVLSSATNVVIHSSDTVKPGSEDSQECATSDFCLNNGRCLILKSLGRKYCKCPIGFTGYRCLSRINSSHGSDGGGDHEGRYMKVTTETSIIISGIAIGTLVFAGVMIAVFCLISKCTRKRRQRMTRCDSEVRPPSLPDGVVFNVKNLHDAINQSATDYSNLSRESAAFTSFDAGEGPRRTPAVQHHQYMREYNPPVLRQSRSSHIGEGNNFRCSGAFQMQLQRLSMHSQLSDAVLPPPSDRPHLPPVLSVSPELEQGDAAAAVAGRRQSEARHDDQLNAGSIALPTATGDGSNVCQSDQQTDAGAAECAASPPSSQCSHTESLMCSNTAMQLADAAGVASGQSSNKSNANSSPARFTVPNSASVPQWYENVDVGLDGLAGSDISEPYDDDNNAIDLEVNFESEADVLGVETSGDELDRVGTSRDFSEMSSQLTERGFSDDDDDCNRSTQSESEDGIFDSRGPLLLGFTRSGSDLSWDESADLPSFAIGAGAATALPTAELNGLLQFSKS